MKTTPQTLVAVAYARIATQNALASARFAEEINGLQRSDDEHDDVVLRADDRSRSLVFAQAIEPSLGVEAWDDATLDACESRLNANKFPVRRASLEENRARRVQGALIARDATGNTIEIVVRPERSGTRFFGRRDAGIRGLFGVGLRSSDPSGDLRFGRTLGADVCDYVGEIAYLAIDEAHHRIALYPSRTRGLLYVALEVASLDDVMRGSYFLSERQIKVVQGPGRQPASDQVFLHFRGPEGLIYAYVTATARRERLRPPRQFPLAAESLCAWGSRADGVPELFI